MNNGWIKMHRKITEWEWYDDNHVYRVFTHLLLTANHEERKWHGATVLAGQKITSLQHLAQETGLTVQNVRTAISKLKSTNELTIKRHPHYSLITILKWRDYQGSTITSTDDQQGTNRVSTTNKKYKNDKNNTYSLDFEEFYETYPLKVGKAVAHTSWLKIQKEEREKFVGVIKKQIELHHFRGNDGKDYIPHPATWLNQKRWEDDIKKSTIKQTSISL